MMRYIKNLLLLPLMLLFMNVGTTSSDNDSTDADDSTTVNDTPTPKVEDTKPSPTVTNTSVEPDKSSDTDTSKESGFTQADVNRIIGERLREQETKLTGKWLSTLQVANLDEAVSLISDLKAKNSELVKASEDAVRAARDSLLGEALIEQGVQPKLLSKARALAQVDGIDMHSAINEDGAIDSDKLKELTNKLKENNPFLFAKPFGSPSNRNATSTAQPDKKDVENFFVQKFGKW